MYNLSAQQGDFMPISSKDGGYPVSLKVPEQRLSKRFHSESEILEWIQQEIRFWESLNNPSNFQRFQMPSEHTSFMNAITVRLLRDAEAYGGGPARLEYVESSGVMLSEGKQAKFLSTLLEQDPTLYPGAFAALAATLRPVQPQSIPAQSNGYPLPWALWMSGLGGVLKYVETANSSGPDRREIEELTSRAHSVLQELETQSRQLTELHDTENDRLEKLSTTTAQAFEQTLSSFRLHFQDRLDQSASSLADYEKLVRERLALEAPTSFWTAKAQSHRNVAIFFGIVFLAATVGGVYWITHFGVDLVSDADKRIVGSRENPGLLALVPLAFITLPTLAFAWILRHISRIVVQNLALQADAQLRSTIANTYTALTSQNQSTPAELAIALNALFRPIDGAGHAEIAPPNIRDILEAGKT